MRWRANPLIFWGELCPVLGRMTLKQQSNSEKNDEKGDGEIIHLSFWGRAMFGASKNVLPSTEHSSP